MTEERRHGDRRAGSDPCAGCEELKKEHAHLAAIVDSHIKWAVKADDSKALQALMDERDTKYTERWEAQEKAITKQEASQNQYNATHNDLARKMDGQYKEMQPSKQADERWVIIVKDLTAIRKDITDARDIRQQESAKLRDDLLHEINNLREGNAKEIAGLRESRERTEGGRAKKTEIVGNMQWAVGIGLTMAGLFISLGILGSAIIQYFFKGP